MAERFNETGPCRTSAMPQWLKQTNIIAASLYYRNSVELAGEE
jgi:hypothetical protein